MLTFFVTLLEVIPGDTNQAVSNLFLENPGMEDRSGAWHGYECRGENTRRNPLEKGIRAEKIRVYPRGIDVEKFHPAKRNGALKKHFDNQSKTTLIYEAHVLYGYDSIPLPGVRCQGRIEAQHGHR